LFSIPHGPEETAMVTVALALQSARYHYPEDELVVKVFRLFYPGAGDSVTAPNRPPAEVEKGMVAKKRGRPRKAAAEATASEGESGDGQQRSQASGRASARRGERTRRPFLRFVHVGLLLIGTVLLIGTLRR
jgi:hypothetical protein